VASPTTRAAPQQQIGKVPGDDDAVVLDYPQPRVVAYDLRTRGHKLRGLPRRDRCVRG
jgi:hypothetical protein